MKNQNTNNLTGKLEVEIAGTKYVGTINLKNVLVSAVNLHPEKPSGAAVGQAANRKHPAPYTVYGVKIDRTNPNPEAAVTYTHAAAGFAPATATSAGSWSDKFPFNQIKPCLFKNGAVVDYLNPDNYAETETGAAADITSGNAGDVMVEFPKAYYRIMQDDDCTYVEITEAATSLADGFTDYAYSYKGSARDKFYIGAYKGYELNGSLRSLSGQTPTVKKTIGKFRAAAQSNGEGYEITPFNKLTLLQVLYLIRFKSLNSQAALGAGYVYGDGVQETGETNALGLYHGKPDTDSRVKCHGIEDLWGNILEWVDGLVTHENAIKIADGNFNDAARGYEPAAELKGSIYGFISGVRGDNKLGFLISECEGNSETYYGDYGSCWLASGGGVCVPFAGGYWGDGGGAGAFCLGLGSSPSGSYSGIGARLCFCA
jgi:hypothetical protein